MDCEEKIYVENPQGMSDIEKYDCIISNKCIYGLVQAARQYYKKAIKILKNLGFLEDNVNPCLYVKKSVKSIVYTAFYIYDNLMVGEVKAVDDAISVLQDYLSCELQFSKNEKRTLLGQPHLIKIWKRNLVSMCRMFGVIKRQECLNFLLVWPVFDNDKISTKDQQEYLLDVGMLLYLVKHPQPVLANVTRELLKANNDAILVT